MTGQQQQYNVGFCFIFKYMHLEQYYIRIFNKNGEFYSGGNFHLKLSPIQPSFTPYHHSTFNTEPCGPLRESTSPVFLKSSVDFGSLGSSSSSPCGDSLALHDGMPGTSEIPSLLPPRPLYQPPDLLTDLLTYQTHILSKAPEYCLLVLDSLPQTSTWFPLPPSGLCSMLIFSKHSPSHPL